MSLLYINEVSQRTFKTDKTQLEIMVSLKFFILLKKLASTTSTQYLEDMFSACSRIITNMYRD